MMVFATTTRLLSSLILMCIHLCITHAETNTKLSFETITSGSFSDIMEPRQEVYRSESDFEVFWKQHVGGTGSLPSVDFKETMVLSTFRGDQISGGYTIAVDSITETDTEIVVKTKISDPEYDDVVTMAITQPFHVVITKASTKPVYFCDINTVSIQECVQASEVMPYDSGNRSDMNHLIATWFVALFISFL